MCIYACARELVNIYFRESFMKKYLSSTLIACILCFIIGFGTACSCSDVEIKEIYFNSTTIDLVVGDIIECDAEKLGLVVLPKNATNQDVNFIVTKEDRTSNGVKIKVLDDYYVFNKVI